MAHDYLLGPRSGIDWLIDRYYIKTDKNSRIVNDPNQWGLERSEPRYILDLIKRGGDGERAHRGDRSRLYLASRRRSRGWMVRLELDFSDR